jgi:argininosuccinate lyase
MNPMRTLWGGAFKESTDELVARFGQSIESDLRFWQEDLVGGVAHARMLGETGIITKNEAGKIIKGLEEIHDEGPDALPKDVEDIHFTTPCSMFWMKPNNSSANFWTKRRSTEKA